MCGIAGILRWNSPPPAEAEIEAMTRAVAHRGPDGQGRFLRDGVALGHRRLAIIDVEGGRQPMHNEDGSVWITFNGEIYNFQELRAELEPRGHVFATRSDTEVLVHAYEEWGPEMLGRLRGMFAFAIADFRERRVLLARDHFGIKPLYYRQGRDYLAFASELSALRQVHDGPPRGRIDAIEYYFRYRYIPGPETIYEDVFHLPPASYAVVDFEGRLTGPVRYWQFQFQPDVNGSAEEWTERFEAVVAESVKAHLVADVPFGVFLSGGIDSTLVAQNMSEILEHPVTAFCIGFDESSYTEVKYAETAAKTLGIDLKTEIVHADVAHLLPELVQHYGQPYADLSMIPTWYLSRLARAHVPMVLSGDGGDEGFAGYERYSLLFHGELWGEVMGLAWSPRGLLWRTPRIWNALRHPSSSKLARWEAVFGGYTPALRRSLWQREFEAVVDQPCPAFTLADREAAAYRDTTYGQFVDLQTYLHADILTKVDIASMCHGLEVRTPLIDLRVWELAARVPSAVRSRNLGWGRKELKSLPKQALRRRFPKSFVDRRKMGFGIPEDHWMQPGAPVRSMHDDLLRDPRARLFELLQEAPVRKLTTAVDHFHTGGGNLWAMLILALWLEQNREITFAPR